MRLHRLVVAHAWVTPPGKQSPVLVTAATPQLLNELLGDLYREGCTEPPNRGPVKAPHGRGVIRKIVLA